MATNPGASLKFPLGADNRSREYEVPAGAARQVENLDITREGGLLCRKGARRIGAGACHSLYVPPHGKFMLLVRDGNLCGISDDGNETVLAPVNGTIRYASMDGVTYWSDGVRTGRVKPDGTTSPWGIPSPPPPSCSASGTGGLPGGIVQMAMTAIHPDGLESGAMDSIPVVIQEGGGIMVTAPVGPAWSRFGIYLTPPHGESHELRLAAVLDSGESVTIGVHEPGRRLESLRAMAPPPCRCLACYRGKLWMADGPCVWFTSEYSPHWVFPSSGYFLFESPVTLLGAAENGLYVGLAESTYFMKVDSPAESTRRMVSALGALPGGGEPLPVDAFGQDAPWAQCGWWDSEGAFCVGRGDGVIVRPSVSRHTIDHGVSASGAYRRAEGLRQWVSVIGRSAHASAGFQAADTPLTDLFSHGIILE